MYFQFLIEDESTNMKAGGSYSEIGKAKCEWADKIGACLHLHGNESPSYKNFMEQLEKRIFT